MIALHRHERPVLVAAIVLSATVAVGQQVWIHSRPKPVRVLNYPQQRVLSTLPGVNGPAARVGGNLQVRGTKCNVTSNPIPLTGVVSWVSLDPPGSVIETGEGHTIRPPGCVTKTFTNPIPASVAARTRELADTVGAECTVWQITGREVPDDPLQLPQTWLSEPFQVCV